MADAMKLLPCPMCGGEATLLDYEARYGGLHYASRSPQCASCGCSMGYLPTAKKAVEAWNCRAYMPAPEKAPSFDDARRKLIHCIEQWDGETEYDAEDIAALADDILDAFGGPPAREEAPALIDTLNAASAKVALNPERAAEIRANWTNGEEAPAEGAGDDLMKEVMWAMRSYAEVIATGNEEKWAKISAIIDALRNRTSEPEAGAVAWRVRWKPLERSQPGAWREPMTERPKDEDFVGYEIQPLFDHPAPATADKLKDTLALFRAFVQRNVGQWQLGAGDHGHPMWGLVAEALGDANRTEFNCGPQYQFIQPDNRQALAALNEEGK